MVIWMRADNMGKAFGQGGDAAESRSSTVETEKSGKNKLLCSSVYKEKKIVNYTSFREIFGEKLDSIAPEQSTVVLQINLTYSRITS